MWVKTRLGKRSREWCISGSQTGPHARTPITADHLTIQPFDHPDGFTFSLSLLSQGQGIPSVLRGCLEIIQTEFSSNQNILKLPFHQKFNYDDLADQIGSDGGSSQGSTYSPFHGGHHASTPPHHQTTTSLPHHHITTPPHHQTTTSQPNHSEKLVFDELHPRLWYTMICRYVLYTLV